jgi:hypothetical protein
MAPEQIRGTPPVSHKTDLYALGVVLYQLLVGKPPFEGSTPVVLMHSHLNEPAPRPSARIHEIPKALDELIINLMAKTPADRPWDAAAVGMKLTELRDKANRGASIAMVWPKSQAGGKAARGSAKGAVAVGVSSAIAGDESSVPVKKKARKSGTLSRTTGKDRTALGGGISFDRSTLETAGLVLALVAIGGFIAYWLWPPSAEFLHRKAEALMASSRRSDWKTARDDYMKELDDRFPDHPYQQEIRAWRDKILLEDAENRGKNLTSGLNIDLTKPSNLTEQSFVIAHQRAAKASDRFDDLTALKDWQELAEGLKEAAKPHKTDDPIERQWYLLAVKRAEQLESTIKVRREYVEKEMAQARAALRAGRQNEANMIHSQLVEQFSKYTDLADLFAPAANVSDSDSKATTPAQEAKAPSAEHAPSSAPKAAADRKELKEQTESPTTGTSPTPDSQPPPVPKDVPPES